VDSRNPVVKLEILEKSWNGPLFSQYVQSRKLPKKIKHDLIDYGTLHRAIGSCKKEKTLPVSEAYSKMKIKQLWIPPGFPEYSLIEQFFNYLDAEVKKEFPKFVKEGKWEVEDLKKVINQASKKVDLEVVKG
jgi:transposase